MSGRQGSTQDEEEHARVTKPWHWQRMAISTTEKFMRDGKRLNLVFFPPSQTGIKILKVKILPKKYI